jgi:hypothetical protein
MARRFVAAVLTAGVVVGLATPPRRLADASTYVLMADSLWNDGDLAYTPADFARAERMHFEDLPNGLFLVQNDSTYRYAKPLLYPLLATPWYGALGLRGFMAFNGFLLAALLLLGADILARRIGWRRGLLGSAIVFSFSVTPAYLHWIDPFLLGCVLVAGVVGAYRRKRPLLCGLLLAGAGAVRVPYLALAIAPALLFALQRRWRNLGELTVAATAGVLLVLAINLAGTGHWSPYFGDRRFYVNAFPFEVPGAAPIGSPSSRTQTISSWRAPPLRELGRNAFYLLFGRFAGLLPYFPSLFACAFWVRRWDAEKLLWMLGLGACCLVILLLLPHNMFGGAHALGNRFFVLLPIALVMVDFLAPSPPRIAACAALLLLAVPVMEAPVYYSVHPGLQMLELPYRLFPYEWTQARRIPGPVPFPGMTALTPHQYGWDGKGVWTIGGTKAEFVLVRRAGEPATVHLWSLVASARIGDGGFVEEMSLGPQARKEITLIRPKAVFRDENVRYKEYAVYDLTVETRRGARPAALGKSDDRRDLGVLVEPVLPASSGRASAKAGRHAP